MKSSVSVKCSGTKFFKLKRWVWQGGFRGDWIASNSLTTHKTDNESCSDVLKMLFLRDVENLRSDFNSSLLFLTLSCPDKSDKHISLEWRALLKRHQHMNLFHLANRITCLCWTCWLPVYFIQFYEVLQNFFYIYIIYKCACINIWRETYASLCKCSSLFTFSSFRYASNWCQPSKAN